MQFNYTASARRRHTMHVQAHSSSNISINIMQYDKLKRSELAYSLRRARGGRVSERGCCLHYINKIVMHHVVDVKLRNKPIDRWRSTASLAYLICVKSRFAQNFRSRGQNNHNREGSYCFLNTFFRF